MCWRSAPSEVWVETFQFRHGVPGVFQDGAVFGAAVLDIKSDVLVTKFMTRIANVVAFGKEAGIPSEAGMPQMFARDFTCCCACL